MHKINVALVAVILAVSLLAPAGVANADDSIHFYVHVQPGTRIDTYTWVCARDPDQCPALDGFKAHLSSRMAGPDGLAEGWLTYGNVVVITAVKVDYAQGLKKTYKYDVQAVLTALKYPVTDHSAVQIWSSDPNAGSYVAGPVVVLLHADHQALFDRIAARVKAGETETEDMWKTEISALAAQIKPGW
jgi:hypothetical protein